MRILFVALVPPFPPNNGHRMRNWSLIKAMAGEGHSLSVVSFASAEDFSLDLAPLREICERVDLIPLNVGRKGRWADAWGRGRALISTLPYGVFKYESRELKEGILTLMREQEYDSILCDDVYLFKNLPVCKHGRTLLNKDDLTFVVLRRLLAQTRNPLKRAYGWFEYLKLRRWETQVSSSVALVLLCSEEDRRLLLQVAPSAKTIIAPNVIDVGEYVPQPEDQNGPLLFFGAMDYHANQDAVEFFLSRILPEIRRRSPAIKFVIAGRNPPEWLQRRIRGVANVSLTGSVADMRSEIAKSSICVVPLRIASGTRLKILEAAAMCKPVVSTRIGAEGLDFKPGAEILLADEPAEFAQAVGALLRDGAMRESMGRAARRRVENQYSIDSLREALHESLSAYGGAGTSANPAGSVATPV